MKTLDDKKHGGAGNFTPHVLDLSGSWEGGGEPAFELNMCLTFFYNLYNLHFKVVLYVVSGYFICD